MAERFKLLILAAIVILAMLSPKLINKINPSDDYVRCSEWERMVFSESQEPICITIQPEFTIQSKTWGYSYAIGTATVAEGSHSIGMATWSGGVYHSFIDKPLDSWNEAK